MLIESAFTYLPEILSGSNYEAQGYEAGIVNAISLAVLQELNARNVPNPLSALTIEKPYSKDAYPNDFVPGDKRYLRADLFLNTTRSGIYTPAISRFGWRDLNYLEAKYFRPTPGQMKLDVGHDDIKATTTVNAASLLADLIRLCCLPPPQVLNWDSYVKAVSEGYTPKEKVYVPYDGYPSPTQKFSPIIVGRYLLHVYLGSPDRLVGMSRDWVAMLRNREGGSIDVTVSTNELDTFVNNVSDKLKTLRLEATVTNRVIDQSQSGTKFRYLCVLTRIDSFTVSIDGKTWSENKDGEGVEGADGDWQAISQIVGSRIGLCTEKPKTTTEDENEELTEDELASFSGATFVHAVQTVTTPLAPFKVTKAKTTRKKRQRRK